MATYSDEEYGKRKSLRILQWLLLAGVISIIPYSFLTKQGANSASIACTLLMIGGASLMVGSVAGFIFAVPRAGRAVEANKPEETHRVNTNLEQISDWLVKILVGVGLTQLVNIPQKLQDSSTYMSEKIGFVGSEVYIGAEISFYVICGFLYGYLWTRLYLAGAIKVADERMTILLQKNIAELDYVEEKLKGEDKLKVKGLREESEKALRNLGPEHNDIDKQLYTLAEEYERLRKDLNPSRDRTIKLGGIVGQIRSLALGAEYKPQNAIKLFKSNTEGKRIAAIAIMRVKPQHEYFQVLAEAIGNCKSSFEQYQALKAMENITGLLTKEEKLQLKSILEKEMSDAPRANIKQNSDRWGLATRILEKI